jgi:hypothetical protein
VLEKIPEPPDDRVVAANGAPGLGDIDEKYHNDPEDPETQQHNEQGRKYLQQGCNNRKCFM